ncbi:MAG: ABC transporter substrate-binding protein, partial [Limnobacter sp.]|nr:ABC transporter substrate-binding protein [Limnobacter sp.]
MFSRLMGTGRFMIRIFAMSLLAFFAGLAQSSDASAQPSIAVSRTPLSLPIIVAREQGFFQAQGLTPDITECIGGTRCLNSLLSGKSQYATCSELPIVFASFKRQDFALLASFVSNTKDMKLLVQSDLMSGFPQSLKGQKIGIVAESASHYYLDLVLSLYGLEPDSVERVPLAPEKLTPALATGKVQGISAWEPYGFKTTELMAEQVAVVDDLSVFNQSFNLVVTKEHLTNHPEQAEKLLRALKLANAFIQENPGRAKEILSQWLDLKSKFVEYSFPDHDYRLSITQSLVTSMLSQRQWAAPFAQAPSADAFSIFELIDTRTLKSVEPSQVKLLGDTR